jgi:hypothetical protein
LTLVLAQDHEAHPTIHPFPSVISVDGVRDKGGIVYWGKAVRQPSGHYHCIANVFGSVCKVEVSIHARCPECGGVVQLCQGEGRTRELRRGVVVPIPDDFEILTCVKCGETYMIPEVSEPLDQLLSHAIEFPT